MKVIKRDGRAVDYDREKIKIAINKANNEVNPDERVSDKQIENIIRYIESLKKKRILVEDIQDIIEQKLMDLKKFTLAKEYIIYRYNRALVRKSNLTDESILSLVKNSSKNEQYQKRTKNNTNQAHLIASEVSKDLTKRVLLPFTISQAFQEGELLFHDSDYFIQPMFDSSLIDLKAVLEDGVTINNIFYSKPSNFIDACFISALVLQEISSNQYGKALIYLEDLSEYSKDAEEQEIQKGVELFFKILTTLKNGNGIYPAFDFYLSFDRVKIVNKYFLLEYLKYLQKEIKINFTFIVALYEKDERELLDLTLACSKNKGNIIYLGSSKEKELLKFVFPPIGNCYLAFKSKDKEELKGHFIIGRVSINLIDLYIDNQESESFYQALETRLNLAKEALLVRYYALLGTLSDTYPLLYQSGAIAKLSSGSKIDALLRKNNAYLVLGYSGLNVFGYELGFKVLKFIKAKVDSWQQELGILFRVKEEPSSVNYFKDKLEEKYGELKIINDYGKSLNSRIISYQEQDFKDIVLLKSKDLEISPDGLVFKISDPPYEDRKEILRLIKFLSENLLLFSLE
mgnify:CR=1 FL=1